MEFTTDSPSSEESRKLQFLAASLWIMDAWLLW